MPSAALTLPRRAAAGARDASPRAVLAVMCVGYFLVLLDVTIVNVALGFSVANAASAAMNLGTLGTLFVLTLFLQTVQGRSPIDAGLAIVPLFALLAIAGAVAGAPAAAGFVGGFHAVAIGAAVLYLVAAVGAAVPWGRCRRGSCSGASNAGSSPISSPS